MRVNINYDYLICLMLLRGVISSIGQESDFSVQATRYTYLKEIRAKEKCDEIGYIFSEGNT